MGSEVGLCVIDAKYCHNRVRVAMAHLMLGLQESDLLHVGFAGNLLELFHPEIDWLSILLLDRRKV